MSKGSRNRIKDGIPVVSKVTRKPSRLKNLGNGKQISAVRQRSKTTEDGKKTASQSKRTKKTRTRIYK